MTSDFTDVTELAGEPVSQEQVQRLCNRYYWAARYCAEKTVLEVACGAGQGLGYLAGVAKSITAGDYSDQVLAIARRHYDGRLPLERFDAQNLPFPDRSFDVVILFEAIYYLPAPERFVQECRRVLRPLGRLLIVTANKDLYDFNPSPHSRRYFGVPELNRLLSEQGFNAEFFGDTPVDRITWRQRLLRPVKLLAVRGGLMPKTMMGKALLKRLVFGRLVSMPAEIRDGLAEIQAPTHLTGDAADRRHKVIYCAATLM